MSISEEESLKGEKATEPFPLYPYKWQYERLYFPRRWWSPSVLFDRLRWSPYLSPGYRSALNNLFSNIYVFLTPWARNQRVLISNFVNANEMKLLEESPFSAYGRIRGFDGPVNYYRLVVSPFTFRATLYREQTIEKATGNSVVTFGVFVKALMTGNAPAEDAYVTTREKIISGMALTRGQCQRLFDRIVQVTPDCGWFNPALF